MPSCPTCGAEVSAMDVHLVWHDSLAAALDALTQDPLA